MSLNTYLKAAKVRFSPAEFLIAGPFVGEFGFELMAWHAYVRRLRQGYAATYVITYPGRTYLYEGCQIVEHSIRLERAGYAFGSMSQRELALHASRVAKEKGLRTYDVINAELLRSRVVRRLLIPPLWKILGSELTDLPQHDVAFHFRNITKDGSDQRQNFPIESCERLASFCQESRLKCVAVGHPEYSYCPRSCHDARSHEVGDAVKALAGSALIVGQLSGPMHLASLCAKPILTWADGAWRVKAARSWNPHKSPIIVATESSFCPEPETVFSRIQLELGRLQT